MKGIFRKISVIAGLAILVLGIYFSGQVGNAKNKSANNKPAALNNKPQTMVFARTVSNASFQSSININGKVIASQKIDLFAEVNGQLMNMPKAFREGTRFKKGELMLEIDNTEAKLELQAQRSQLYSILVSLLPAIDNDYNDNLQAWTNYVENFDINQEVQAFPASKSKREKLFIAGKNIQQLFYSIKKLEHRLTKYKIYAPFDGVLSNTSTYEGALIRGGQRLGIYSHPSQYELEASVSLYDMPFLKPGSKVSLRSEAFNEKWTGTVSRLGKSVDPGTQTQKLFIRLNSAKLNEGMFLNGKVTANSIDNVCKLPRTLLINNGLIYIIQQGKLTLQNIEIVKVEHNDMYVKGLDNNTTILAKPLLEAYDGMPVKIIE